MATLLETDSGSALNITTIQATGSYTASGEKVVMAQVRLSSLNGAAALVTAKLAQTSAADAAIAPVRSQWSVMKNTATDTVFGGPLLGPVYLADGEKAVASVLSSNASDTSVTWSVEWLDVGSGGAAASIDAQDVVDALKLTYTAGDPAAGSPAAILAAIPTAAAIGTDAASKILATPAQKIATDEDGKVTTSNPSTGVTLQDVTDAVEASGALAGAIVNIAALAGGSGSTSFSYALTTSAGTPIPGARVWITTDEAGANVVAYGTTNSYGAAAFNLEPGTVYVWAEKVGYSFDNPDTEVVS